MREESSITRCLENLPLEFNLQTQQTNEQEERIRHIRFVREGQVAAQPDTSKLRGTSPSYKDGRPGINSPQPNLEGDT